MQRGDTTEGRVRSPAQEPPGGGRAAWTSQLLQREQGPGSAGIPHPQPLGPGDRRCLLLRPRRPWCCHGGPSKHSLGNEETRIIQKALCMPQFYNDQEQEAQIKLLSKDPNLRLPSTGTGQGTGDIVLVGS